MCQCIICTLNGNTFKILVPVSGQERFIPTIIIFDLSSEKFRNFSIASATVKWNRKLKSAKNSSQFQTSHGCFLSYTNMNIEASIDLLKVLTSGILRFLLNCNAKLIAQINCVYSASYVCR